MTDAPSDPLALSPGAIAHRQSCGLHDTARQTHCNALTRYKSTCSRLAKNFSPGFLPTCGQHASQKIESGRCQATETCGHLCERLTPYAPPFHLCSIHCEGTDTLPCYLMRLPAEVRLMIFRYLFPDFIPAEPVGFMGWKSLGMNSSVLRVNRKIHEEASSVLYGKVPFHVSISSRRVWMLGQQWGRDSDQVQPGKTYLVLLIHTILPATARRIQNLEVEVAIGRVVKRHLGIGDNGISHEECNLFETRDSVRNFVELMNPDPVPPPSLFRPSKPTIDMKMRRKLQVKPVLEGYPGQDFDEIVAATVLVVGPFKDLKYIYRAELKAVSLGSSRNSNSNNASYPLIGNPYGNVLGNAGVNDVRYKEYQLEWQECLTAASPLPTVQEDDSEYFNVDYAVYEARALAESLEYQKERSRDIFLNTQNFVELLYQQDNKKTGDRVGRRPWTESVFAGIQRPWHLARKASEEFDEFTVRKVQEAIKHRWVNYQRKLRRDSAPIADMLDLMWDMYSDEENPAGEYPDAFKFKKQKLVKGSQGDPYWAEIDLSKKDEDWPNTTDWPERSEKNYTFWEDSEREYFKRKNSPLQTYTRLKTPALVRAARASRQEQTS